MTEITCSQCGAENPGHSKYCNKCGASLGNLSTHICPSCGTVNPLTLLYCDHCGTRLIDDTATGSQDETDDADEIARSQPFSLPARPPGQTGNLDVSSELPDWLKTGEFSTNAAEVDDEPIDQESDQPEWLRAAHEEEAWEDDEAPTLEELSEDHKPQDDLPTWLLDETTADDIFRGEKSTDELFMASLAPDDDDAPRETGSVLKDDLPEWLQGLSPMEEEPAPSDQISGDTPFSQPRDTEPPEAPVEPQSDTESDDMISELQGWLSDMEETDHAPSGLPGEELLLDDAAFETYDQTPSDVVESEDPRVDERSEARLDDEDDFLNWLSEIQEEPMSDEELPADLGSDPLQNTGLPGWLDESDLDMAIETDEADIEEADDDRAPAWLHDVSDEPLAPESAQASTAFDLEAPDWMMRDERPGEEATQPGSIQQAPYEEESPVRDTEATDDTEGLRSAHFEDEAAASLPAEEVASPASPDEGITEQDIPEDEFLQWLDALDASPSGVETAEQPDVDEIVAPPTEPVAHDMGGEDDVALEAEAGLPEWLDEFAEAEGDATASTIADVEALPDWLRDLAPPGADVKLPYVSGTENLPQDTEIEESVPEEDEFVIEQEVSAERRVTYDMEAFPDWLDGVTDELDPALEAGKPQTSEATETRDEEAIDLTGVEYGPDSQEVPFDLQTLGLDEQEVPTEDLPDWFSDVLMNMPSQETPESPPSSPTLTNVPEQLAGDELPQWLDSPFSDETVAEPTPIEEIPEWLRAPLKERLARAAEERGLDESALESGDEWRELLHSTATDLESKQREASTSDTSAWLESLRAESSSGVKDDGASEREETTDSPLAELQGKIGIAPVVARSAKRDSVTAVTDQAQAQQTVLLRQLARSQQEDDGRIIADLPREKGLSLPGRVILSLLLLAAVVIGLMTSNPAVTSAGETPPGSLPSVNAEMLALTTGQPVLLVFDYTPAMAGVLHAPASEAARTIEDQGNHLMVTSQSAAGLGLARRILDTAADTQVDDLGLIPGGAAGIRRLAQCIDTASPCDDLFGQPLDPETSTRLSEAAHVVVVTGDRDNLIAWVEQMNGVRFASMSAIVTPALEPIAAPYLATEQLTNLGVAMGTSTRTDSIMDATAAPALLYTHWLVLVLVAGGAIYYLTTGALRSRRK